MSEQTSPGGAATSQVERGDRAVVRAGRTPNERRRVWAAVAGTLLVPGLLWAAIPLVPFLPLATGEKLWVSGGLAVAAEVVFWVSALLLGREVARRYRRSLDPRRWLRKRRAA